MTTRAPGQLSTSDARKPEAQHKGRVRGIVWLIVLEAHLGLPGMFPSGPVLRRAHPLESARTSRPAAARLRPCLRPAPARQGPKPADPEPPAEAYPCNIMYDRRVARGNTYAARVLPAEPGILATRGSGAGARGAAPGSGSGAKSGTG